MSLLNLGRKTPVMQQLIQGAVSPLAPQAADDWSSNVRTESTDVAGWGAKAALMALIGFVAWGALVPIDSAVHAQGTVIAQGRNKLVQHKVGGIVRKILATEGQKVQAGDALLELEPSIDRAQLSQFKARFSTMAAMKRRLDAEKGINTAGFRAKKQVAEEPIGADEITNSTDQPDDSAATSAADEQSLLVEQQREFEKGRDAIAAEVASLKDRAEGQRRTRIGLVQREESIREQVILLTKQRASLQRLVAKDAMPKQKLWDVENQLLDRKAELDRMRAERDAIAKSITEIESNISTIRAKDQRLTSEKLTEVLGNMAELRDQISAAERSLKDTVIRAPVSGTLVHVNAVTEGGVVIAGEPIAEVVPDGAVIELLARVRPEDIAYVHVGQEAEMKVSALNARLFDKVPGEVVYIAADASEDKRTGEKYFEVRGKLDVAAMQRQSGVTITPGMNGEVFLKGQKRPFLAYLIQPIRDGISTAFKEPH